MIADGRFDVRNSHGRFPPLAEGDVFGEIAPLRDVPRTPTVNARPRHWRSGLLSHK